MVDEVERRNREQAIYAFMSRIPLSIPAIVILLVAGLVTLRLWLLDGFSPGVLLPFTIALLAFGWGWRLDGAVS